MASYTVTSAKHATLAANTVDTVTYSDTGRNRTVEILNRSDSDIYATFGTGTPTVAGDNTYVVPARTALRLPMLELSIKLISSGAAAYTITATP